MMYEKPGDQEEVKASRRINIGSRRQISISTKKSGINEGGWGSRGGLRRQSSSRH